MKILKTLLLICIFPLLSIAQEKGIKFEHNTNWEQVKAKAKAENKHIFVDCFTTWCGPCKWMAENVFVEESVGDFFNENYVNLKIQFDETKNDSEDVKSWYQESKRFTKEYNVTAYPTFLVFNPDGELVDKIIGGNEAEAFIATFKNVLLPENQFLTVKKKFIANPSDLALAKSILPKALDNKEDELIDLALNTIIKQSSKEELLSEENMLSFIRIAEGGVNNKAFEYIYNNKEPFEKFMLSKYQFPINDLLAFGIIKSEVTPQLYSGDEIDFDALSKNLSVKYDKIDLSKALESSRLKYLLNKKDWKEFVLLFDKVVENNKNISANQLNQYAWTFFEECSDKEGLKSALKWSKLSLDKEPNEAALLDTYANLLYKLGDKENALIWQEKAVNAASEDLKEELSANLDKMKQGIPTWE
ncbi:thioredoxin family protein [Sphingobacterium bovistauri]|uniref:Thioredoxin family protein n=1 Tax=Sphingobacterium bovistauri TaxID=2781959 RepID=A0ABS7Z0K4_9SPHI|nr:thioredoxin fold domain-containing protein [Sphingobacterium bovistauri]MCA5003694.1 thioredoxin family protein [Sphingobacterium bovistauri]